MRRFTSLSAALAVAASAGTAAAGGLNVDLTVPGLVQTPGGPCYNNGPEVFDMDPGGALRPAARAVTTQVELRDAPPDVVVALIVTDEGDPREVANQRTDVVQNPQTVDIEVPGDDIVDGADRVIRVELRNPLNDAVLGFDTVTIDLDRGIPVIEFTVEAGAQDCQAGPLTPLAIGDDFTLTDEGLSDDEDIDWVVEEACEGCITVCTATEFIRATDECGNVSRRDTTRLLLPPEPLDLAFQHADAALGPERSDLGEDDNPRLSQARVFFEVVGDPSCANQSELLVTTQTGMAEPQILIPGQIFDEEGEYTVEATLGVCGQDPRTWNRTFTVLRKPEADAGGEDGVYLANQGDELFLDASDSFAPAEICPDEGRPCIVEYAWDFTDNGIFDAVLCSPGEDDNPEACDGARIRYDADRPSGEYPFSLRIRAQNDAVAFAFGRVAVEDVSPTCQLAGPLTVTEGESVQLDASGSAAGHPSDPIQAYAWDPGDPCPPWGQRDGERCFQQRAADLPVITHVYDSQGAADVVYEAFVRVEDPDSFCEASTNVTVQDVDPVVQGVQALAADDLEEGVAVRFTAGQTAPGSNADALSNFSWLFGDPGSQPAQGPTARSPSHTYMDDGTFRVCLTVSDEDSSVEECFDVVIADVSPAAEVTGPRRIIEGETAEFDASRSAGNAADPIARYEWDWGDGSDPETTMGPMADHMFRASGNFTVTLTVHDEDSSTQTTWDIVVEDVAPDVVAPNLLLADEGSEIRFDASGSSPGAVTDPIVEYRWDFGDGSDPTEGPVVNHTYADDGEYSATLTVVDEDGTEAETTIVVRVSDIAPTVEIELVSDLVEINTPAMFRALITDPGDDTHNVTWDFGDESPAGNGVDVEHTFGAIGRFTVTVTVIDVQQPELEPAVAELVIEVGRAAPRIVAEREIEGTEGQTLSIPFEAIAAQVDAETIDALRTVRVGNTPPGSVVDLPVDTEERVAGTLEWTPGFADAGTYDVSVVAVAVSGLERTVRIRITILDGGTAVVAAAGGDARRGRVVLFRYGFDRFSQFETFEPWVSIPVGIGIGGMATGDEGRWLFVATPGSGGVAVIDMSALPAPTKVRTIATGSGTTTVVRGTDHAWALNTGEGTLTAIDPVRLKAVRTVSLAETPYPVDMTWIPDSAEGIDGPRLAVIDGESGMVVLVDPAAVLAGDADISTHSKNLRGRLTRVAFQASTSWLYVIDGKTRQVVRMDAASLSDPERIPTNFAPSDLAVDAEQDLVWIAAKDGLASLGVDGTLTDSGVAADAVSVVPRAVRPGGGLVLAQGNDVLQVEGGDPGQTVHSRAASTPRRLSAFVYRN